MEAEHQPQPTAFSSSLPVRVYLLLRPIFMIGTAGNTFLRRALHYTVVFFPKE